MKCAVIYYSQTGNTELIAKTIHNGIEHAAGHCDLLKIKEADPRNLREYDLIGLGCPVFGFTESLNMRAFIKKMRFVGGKHAFPFCTHGTRPEFFFPSIVPKMEKQGLTVIGMYNCYAPAFGNPLYPTGGHPDEIDLQEAEEFGREMISRSQRITAGETQLIPGLPEWVETDVEKYVMDREIREQELGMPKPQAEKRKMKIAFEFDRERCTNPECWLCMDICPMDGIDLTLEPPVIGKPCMHCMDCAKQCPTGAIRMDRPMMPQSDVPAEVQRAVFEEFYLVPLAKAEAEGRFRRLIPVAEAKFPGQE